MVQKARAAKTPAKSAAATALNGQQPAPLGDAPPPMAERLSFLVHKISARIAMVGNRHFREHDLNHFSARILVLLLEHEELRTGELVELMVLPQSTISSQLQSLHKKKLIRRRRSRQDNRSVIVTLTPAGTELAHDCDELSLRTQAAMLQDIAEEEKQIAFGFLRKMNERLVALEQQELYPFHDRAQVQQLVGLDGARRVKKVARPGGAATA